MVYEKNIYWRGRAQLAEQTQTYSVTLIELIKSQVTEAENYSLKCVGFAHSILIVEICKPSVIWS